MKPVKVALVHDWLMGWGGAEQVLLAFHRCFPDAPVYTSLYDPKNLPPVFKTLDIRTSFLQRVPGALKHYQKLLPLMPLAFEQFDLGNYDLVLSSSHACAKGVITGPDTCHVSYIHTPIRYAWDMYHPYMRQSNPGRLKQMIMHGLLHYLRLWDTSNTQRIDHLLCNSHFVQRRIQKYYRRESTVLHPPVKVQKAKREQPAREDFYLVVGRLVGYKRVDLAIAAFGQNGKPLIIVGDGPEQKTWMQNLPENITYRGAVDRDTLEDLYQRAKALVFPPLEDFGMVPVEAQSFGCPVIAFGKGGALDSIKPGETGVFFREQTAESMNQALQVFEKTIFDSDLIREHAQQFSVDCFEKKLKEFILELP